MLLVGASETISLALESHQRVQISKRIFGIYSLGFLGSFLTTKIFIGHNRKKPKY